MHRPTRSARFPRLHGHPRLHAHPRLPEEPGGHRGDARHPRRGAATGWCRSPSRPRSSSSTPAPSSRAPSRSRSTPSSSWPSMKREGRARRWWSPAASCSATPTSSRREMPEVDHFLGTGAYAGIARIVSDAQATRQVVPDPDYVHAASTPRVNSLPSHTAYLKISEGCDNACAFCIIPTLRGAAALAAHRRPRGRGRGARRAGRARAEPGGAGPDRLRARPARASRSCTTCCPSSARWTGSAGSASTTPTRATFPDALIEVIAARAEDREVPGHAAAARLRPAAPRR